MSAADDTHHHLVDHHNHDDDLELEDIVSLHLEWVLTPEGSW